MKKNFSAGNLDQSESTAIKLEKEKLHKLLEKEENNVKLQIDYECKIEENRRKNLEKMKMKELKEEKKRKEKENLLKEKKEKEREKMLEKKRKEEELMKEQERNRKEEEKEGCQLYQSVLTNLCNCCNKLKDYFTVITHANLGIKINDKLPKLYYFRIIAYAHTSEIERAEKDIKTLENLLSDEEKKTYEKNNARRK